MDDDTQAPPPEVATPPTGTPPDDASASSDSPLPNDVNSSAEPPSADIDAPPSESAPQSGGGSAPSDSAVSSGPDGSASPSPDQSISSSSATPVMDAQPTGEVPQSSAPATADDVPVSVANPAQAAAPSSAEGTGLPDAGGATPLADKHFAWIKRLSGKDLGEADESDELNACQSGAGGQSIDPSQGGSSQAQPEPANMTPAKPYSIDPDQGGSTQAPPPADGGFTPVPGARSVDPFQGGSSQAQPEPPNMTPAKPYSIDPDQGGSSQAPPPADGGFTPAPGAQSIDPDQGGMSIEDPCSIARRDPEFKRAYRAYTEAQSALAPLQTAYDKAMKLRPFKFIPSGIPDPVKGAEADWDVLQAKQALDAGWVKLNNAGEVLQEVADKFGCKNPYPP